VWLPKTCRAPTCCPADRFGNARPGAEIGTDIHREGRREIKPKDWQMKKVLRRRPSADDRRDGRPGGGTRGHPWRAAVDEEEDNKTSGSG
jgi:hypothetical protein